MVLYTLSLWDLCIKDKSLLHISLMVNDILRTIKFVPLTNVIEKQKLFLRYDNDQAIYDDDH